MIAESSTMATRMGRVGSVEGKYPGGTVGAGGGFRRGELGVHARVTPREAGDVPARCPNALPDVRPRRASAASHARPTVQPLAGP